MHVFDSTVYYKVQYQKKKKTNKKQRDQGLTVIKILTH